MGVSNQCLTPSQPVRLSQGGALWEKVVRTLWEKIVRALLKLTFNGRFVSNVKIVNKFLFRLT